MPAGVAGPHPAGQGQLGQALDDAGRAVALARATGDRLNIDPALAFGARVLLAAGREAEAGKLLDELLATLGGRLLKPELGVDLAIGLVELGRPVEELLDDVVPSPRTRPCGSPRRPWRGLGFKPRDQRSRPDEAAARRPPPTGCSRRDPLEGQGRAGARRPSFP